MNPYLVAGGFQAVVSWLLLSRYFSPKKGAPKPDSVMRCTPSTAYICAWCAKGDAGAAIKWAELNKLMPSHGICPTHKIKALAEIS